MLLIKYLEDFNFLEFKILLKSFERSVNKYLNECKKVILSNVFFKFEIYWILRFLKNFPEKSIKLNSKFQKT